MLHAPQGLPCHRVIYRDGTLCCEQAFGGRISAGISRIIFRSTANSRARFPMPQDWNTPTAMKSMHKKGWARQSPCFTSAYGPDAVAAMGIASTISSVSMQIYGQAAQLERNVARPAPAAPIFSPQGRMKMGSKSMFRKQPLMVPMLAWREAPSERTRYLLHDEPGPGGKGL